MTVIISAHGKELVVLGTDSRGTDILGDGSRIETNSIVKMFSAGKYVMVMISGDGDYAYNLVAMFKEQFGTDHADVREAADHIAEIARADARRLVGVPFRDLGDSGIAFIVAGLDFKEGRGPEPKSFRITSESGYKLELPQVGYSIDGKSSIPRFIFAKAFSAEMHVDDLSTLVAQTIAETNRVDNDVGPTVKIVVIDRSGQRELDRVEVEGKIERTEPFVGLVRGRPQSVESEVPPNSGNSGKKRLGQSSKRA